LTPAHNTSNLAHNRWEVDSEEIKVVKKTIGIKPGNPIWEAVIRKTACSLKPGEKSLKARSQF
jgi:hypothetical protein